MSSVLSKRICHNKIPLLIVNDSNATIKLKRNMPVAHAENTNDYEIMSTSTFNDKISKPENADKVNIERETNLDHIPEDKRQPIFDTLKTYSHLFVNKESYLPATKLVKFSTDTGDNPPCEQFPYKVPLNLQPVLDNKIDELLEEDMIRPSISPYVSPCLLVPKKDGGHHLVVYYRRLNKMIKPMSYPLHNTHDMLPSFRKCKYFTCLDMKSGCYKVKMLSEDDAEKTAIFQTMERLVSV